ncbi:MAG TPA: beta-N-acetylhexosaminidase [Clostridia bacterium]|nr:beta-N-acetylhexosaminidase [Clostridia bacterium]
MSNMSPRTRMDLSSLVGQLMIFGFDGVEMTAKLRSALAAMQPGGIILFKRNVVDARQTHALLRESQKLVSTRMFLCVDMEGGTVDRLKDVVAPAPSVEDVVRAGRKELYRAHGKLIGQEVSALGFNVDFAPVVDLGLEPSRSVLTSRTVSASPKETVVYAREFLRGLKDAQVLGCGKHFPGLGEANLDTHESLPAIDKSWKRLWDEDLVPYRMLQRQMPFVMVAHCAYPEVTGDRTPASLSKKWIGDILRKKIGYRGLVISDDLEMGGVLAAASIEDAAVETIRAGADIFLVCRNEEHVFRTYSAVLREAERNAKFRKQVETAARRILNFKRKSPEVNRRMPAAPSELAVTRLRQRIWQFSEELRATAIAEANA